MNVGRFLPLLCWLKLQEVSSSCESGKWIVWEPNLGEDETGWSAHVTDDNFSFMFEHLVE